MTIFRIDTPIATHYEIASCEDVDCPNYANGWLTVLDPSMQAALLGQVVTSGRHYTEMRSEDAAELVGRPLPPGLRAFVFPSGQQCFEEHLAPVGRPPIFRVLGKRATRTHANGRDFNEEFNETSYAIGRAIERD